MPQLHFNGTAIELPPGQSVLDGLLEHGHAIANSCRAGACQACLMQATEGDLPPQAQIGLKPTQASQGYFLACQCRPEKPLSVRLPDMAEHRHAAVVTELQPLSEQVMAVSVRPEGDYPYRPGQYTTLWRDDGLGRSYSLASVPGVDAELRFHVRRVPNGRFSGWVFDQLRPGQRIDLQCATGDCVYLPEYGDDDLLLVGTATGLAPLYGILREALRQGHRGAIHLLHGAYDPQGLYLRDELGDLADRHPHIHYHAAVLEAGDSDVTVAQVDGLALEQLSGLNNPVAYLCGAPDFVQGLRKRLFLAGMAMNRIHADAFLPAAANTASTS